MSILMLHNHIPKIIANQSSNHYDSIYSTPINRLTIVIVGTGSLGGATARMLAPLGPKIIGIKQLSIIFFTVLINFFLSICSFS